MFRLARKLGYAHPDFLLDELTSTQITELQAYDVIDPVGDIRSDYNAAMITSALINIIKAALGDKDNLTTIQDFIPKWGEEQEEMKRMTDDEMLRIMNAMAK